MLKMYDGNFLATDNFDNAFWIVLFEELPEDEYNKYKEEYNWTIPNEPGVYHWVGEDWTQYSLEEGSRLLCYYLSQDYGFPVLTGQKCITVGSGLRTRE